MNQIDIKEVDRYFSNIDVEIISYSPKVLHIQDIEDNYVNYMAVQIGKSDVDTWIVFYVDNYEINDYIDDSKNIIDIFYSAPISYIVETKLNEIIKCTELNNEETINKYNELVSRKIL